MKVYKITDQYMQTYDGFQWELNVPKETDGKGILCSQHFLHFYHHPLIAAILHPMLEFKNKRLFEAEADGIIKNDIYRKGGCSKLTLTKEINLLQFTKNQRIACVILFTQQICKKEQWNTWAINWLNGKDRTKESAFHAYTAFYAANAAHYVANNAAHYAANTSYNSAYYATIAVGFAIEANPDIFTLENITNTINKSLEY